MNEESDESIIHKYKNKNIRNNEYKYIVMIQYLLLLKILKKLENIIQPIIILIKMY